MTSQKKIKSNQLSLGTWLQINSAPVASILAQSEFDWLCLDCEHGAIDIADARSMIDAIKAKGRDAFVRLPECNSIWIKRILDAGADGLIIPMVNSVEIAQKAVEFAKYPPQGKRGFGFSHANDYGNNFHDYIKAANERISLVAQIEHIDAVNDIEAIMSISEIDACIIGPYDLSGSMGIPGQTNHPDVLKACDEVLKTCLKLQKPAGIHVVSSKPEDAQPFIDKGFKFIALGMDTLFLQDGAQQVLQFSPKNN